MGSSVSQYVLYGSKIEPLPAEVFWRIVDDQNEKVTDQVRLVEWGEYDRQDPYLIFSSKEIHPGQPFLVSPYSASDPEYMARDAAIVEAAELIGATLVGGIGWIFVPSRD
jgi:hypothetical protein